MNKLYYIAFTEYDMNHAGLVFKSYEDAYDFGRQYLKEQASDESWDNYVNAGFFEVGEVTIYGE